jgi:hypothetical protein
MSSADVDPIDANGDTEVTKGDSAAAAPSRSVRRATARRASRRRAAARGLHGDEEALIIDYLSAHPESTAGNLARGLNLDPERVASRLTHLAALDEVTRTAHGYTVNDTRGAGSARSRPG